MAGPVSPRPRLARVMPPGVRVAATPCVAPQRPDKCGPCRGEGMGRHDVVDTCVLLGDRPPSGQGARGRWSGRGPSVIRSPRSALRNMVLMTAVALLPVTLLAATSIVLASRQVTSEVNKRM